MLRTNCINVDHGSSYSASDPGNIYPVWLNKSASHISPTSIPKNLNLNMDSPTQGCDLMKQLGWPLHDQNSSSNQSTNQSHPGSEDVDARKATDCNVKSISSPGTHKTAYPALKINFSELYDGVPYTYMDPCLSGYMAAYEPQGMIHHQMTSNAPSGRLPLPIQLTDDGPIYVNAKQYHGILRRRKQRAKLEALNKLAKVRKPYMHESRHRHAMRRIRGPGGRFLNTNQLKKQAEQLGLQHMQTKSYISANDCKASTVPSMMVWGTNLQLMNGNGVASGDSSSSEVTNLSNPGDVFELSDHLGFAEFLGSSAIGVNMLYNGSRPCVPVIR